jgi:hypothetical protein
MNWEPIVFTLLLFLPLLWLVRKVHEGLQETFLILTGHKAIAIYLFQILLLPGVILHELSHLLVARLLGVRIRKVSLQPQVQGEKIQMGAVVMDKPDFFRGLLIGLAPLILGSATVVLIGHYVFDVNTVIDAAKANDGHGLTRAVRAAFEAHDAWIWLYLIFAVSNAMLPSESDREAVWPMVAFFTIITGGVALAGWGPALLSSLSEPAETALSLLSVAFGITLCVDLIFAVVILLLRGSASLLTGRTLEKPT